MRYSGSEMMLVNNEGNGNQGRALIRFTSLGKFSKFSFSSGYMKKFQNVVGNLYLEKFASSNKFVFGLLYKSILLLVYLYNRY